jgi:hypothetical protein
VSLKTHARLVSLAPYLALSSPVGEAGAAYPTCFAVDEAKNSIGQSLIADVLSRLKPTNIRVFGTDGFGLLSRIPEKAGLAAYRLPGSGQDQQGSEQQGTWLYSQPLPEAR